MKSSRPSTCVPQILYTFADQIYTGMFLNACIACPISLTLHSPLDEPSVKLCAASVVAALEDLHKIGVLFRGVSPDVLMFDRTGHLQLSGLQVWEEIVWGKSIYHMWDDRLFSSRNSPRERPWSSC